MSIKEAIQKIMEEKIGGSASMLCTVTAVDGSTCSVTTLDTEIDLYGVRLQAATSNGILLKPKAGSIVVITPITDFEFVVVMFSDIDEITLMDGSFGGLTKTQELKTQLDKTNAVVQAIVDTLQQWTPVSNDGGAALKAFFPTKLLTKTVGDFSDIENSKIIHGTI
jgi:hypothetical protein